MTPWYKEKPPEPVGASDDYLKDWYIAAAETAAAAGGPPHHRAGMSGSFKAEHREEIYQKLRSLGWQRLTKYGYGEEDEFTGNYAWDKGYAEIRVEGHKSLFGAFVLHYNTTDPELPAKLNGLFKHLLLPPSAARPKGTVYMLGRTMGGLKLFNIGHAGVSLKRENYSKAALEGYDLLKADLASMTPSGRFGVMTGPPGTGKTYFLRGLMEDLPLLFILIPSSMIQHMGDPELVPTLLELRESNKGTIVLVLEDGDAAMVKKSVENASTISNMLNATSGILGELIDLRILSTTNADGLELEPALMRACRLSAHVIVERLSPEEATRAYATLETKEPVVFTAPATLAEVYAAARKNGWSPMDKTKLFQEEAPVEA